MVPNAVPNSSTPSSRDQLVTATVATVARWNSESADIAPDPTMLRFARLLGDTAGATFLTGCVDALARADDPRAAGEALERLAHSVPRLLPLPLRLQFQLSAGFASILPRVMVPIARRLVNRMIPALVLEDTPVELELRLRELKERGYHLDLVLLGPAVLGDAEADRRIAGTRELMLRDDVDSVSIAVADTVGRFSLWSFEHAVDRAVERLEPLYEIAASSSTPKFIMLESLNSGDLDLTGAVFARLREHPAIAKWVGGISLQVDSDGAFAALRTLTESAMTRMLEGGSRLTVQLADGHPATGDAIGESAAVSAGDRQASRRRLKRMLDWSLTPERTDAVHLRVQSSDLFDIAYARALARSRGVEERIEFEIPLGLTPTSSTAVFLDTKGLILRCPVADAENSGAALAAIVRSLSVSSGVAGAQDWPSAFEQQKARFIASIPPTADPSSIDPSVVGDDPEIGSANRATNRAIEPVSGALVTTAREFENDRPTDVVLAENRRWVQEIRARVPGSTLGVHAVAMARIGDSAQLDIVVRSTATAGIGWGERRSDTRATVLHSVADSLALVRGELIEVLASETGTLVADGDAEVSAAIDSANYYAERSRELDRVAEAEFAPAALTVVLSPAIRAIGFTAGAVFAALAAGSAVVVCPERNAERSAAVLVEALWAGGIPRSILTLVSLDPDANDGVITDIDIELDDDDHLVRELLCHPMVGQVSMSGPADSVRQVRSWRPDLRIIAEVRGHNALIVTSSADVDRAVGDVVTSAFARSGQSSSGISLLILVGAVASNGRFRRQLVDAVSSLKVGGPEGESSTLGPLVSRAGEGLHSALTTLDPGESWLIRPKLVESTEGRLWTPGIREGIVATSTFLSMDHAGPVLGIAQVATLAEAVELQKSLAASSVAALHSGDANEIRRWMDAQNCAALAVNGGTDRTAVGARPFVGNTEGGGRVGVTPGGPNHLLGLGEWTPIFAEPGESVIMRGISAPVIRVVEAAQQGMIFLEFDRVRVAAKSDERAWDSEYGREHSLPGTVPGERNSRRYRPVHVVLRLAEGASLAQLVRLLAAATRANAPVSISSSVPVPANLMRLFASDAPPIVVRSTIIETDDSWHSRVRSGELQGEAGSRLRVRLIGGDRIQLAAALVGSPQATIHAGPVTTSGRIELLTFLIEQNVSVAK